MTTQTVTPHPCPVTSERDSFWYLVHAEWTKFRTVPGWVVAAGVTIAAIAAFAFLGADVSGGCTATGSAGLPPVRHPPPGLAVSRSRTRSTSCTSRSPGTARSPCR